MRRSMEVEVDLYAGRPNPRWPLDPTLTGELLERLAALPSLVGPAQARDRLGYRGLRITGDQSELLAEILVSDGVVIAKEPGGGSYMRQDRGRELERWIIETGGPNLDPAVLVVLRRDLYPDKENGEPSK
jgi:hypothetical protein